MSRNLEPLIDETYYSAAENLTWRFLKEQCLRRATAIAHPIVLSGLQQLGLLTGGIPSVGSLNKRLQQFGWQVVPVKGFLPPREYLGHIANCRLPIAVNMRARENTAFSAEPDIFHEAFGHVCMLVNASYRSFLQSWGRASVFAFQGQGEQSYFESVRMKAELKSIGGSEPEILDTNHFKVDSEASRLARLGWWTVECGVIKTHGRFKIYGAAILSSSREMDQFSTSSPILPATSASLQQEFDPTELQPQYYYIEGFSELSNLLEQSTRQMAFRRGGLLGLTTAKLSAETAVCRLSSGGRLVGTVIDFGTDSRGRTHLYLRDSSSDQIEVHKVDSNNSVCAVYPSIAESYATWIS